MRGYIPQAPGGQANAVEAAHWRRPSSADVPPALEQPPDRKSLKGRLPQVLRTVANIKHSSKHHAQPHRICRQHCRARLPSHRMAPCQENWYCQDVRRGVGAHQCGSSSWPCAATVTDVATQRSRRRAHVGSQLENGCCCCCCWRRALVRRMRAASQSLPPPLRLRPHGSGPRGAAAAVWPWVAQQGSSSEPAADVVSCHRQNSCRTSLTAEGEEKLHLFQPMHRHQSATPPCSISVPHLFLGLVVSQLCCQGPLGRQLLGLKVGTWCTKMCGQTVRGDAL